MRYEHLIIEKKGAADWVTLNRPDSLNALTAQSLAELNHYFDSLLENYAVRVVVLKGAGRAVPGAVDLPGHSKCISLGMTPLVYAS